MLCCRDSSGEWERAWYKYSGEIIITNVDMLESRLETHGDSQAFMALGLASNGTRPRKRRLGTRMGKMESFSLTLTRTRKHSQKLLSASTKQTGHLPST